MDGTNREVLANKPSDNTSMMAMSRTGRNGTSEGEADNVLFREVYNLRGHGAAKVVIGRMFNGRLTRGGQT